MYRLKSGLWVLLTCVVALATVAALVLPEGEGGRDTFVRLTRAGVHRQCSTEASTHDVEEAEAGVHLGPPGDSPLVDLQEHSASSPAVLPQVVRLALPVTSSSEVLSGTPRISAAGPSSPLSDRAPPAL